jgi:hypothetical protein
MMFFKKMISTKKITTLLVAFLVVSLFDPTTICAAGNGGVGDTASDFLKGFGEIASILVNILTFISILFLNYGGELMGTNLLTGSDVMEAIRPMWVIMRNFTNIGFVILMIFLSVSNLFSSFGEGGNWTIKDKLPKIIFSLVAINFSLLGFRVVIDAVHVGTIAILSISDRILEEKGANAAEKMMQQGYDDQGNECSPLSDTCKTFTQHINWIFCKPLTGPVDAASVKAAGDKCSFALDPNGFSTEPRDQSARNLFMAFGIQFQHLEQLPQLAADLNSWTKVIDSTLFSMIMALAFVVAIVALFIVLLLRVVVLWLGMVFSPFLVAGAIMDFGDGDTGIAKKILINLLVPLKVAAVFAVTFVLISALSTLKMKTGIGANGETFIFFGPALSKLGNEYAILWQIMTIIVFWTATFKAMEGSAAQGIVDKVKAGAQTMGGYVAKSQTIDKPILPWFGGKNISLSTLTKAPQAFNSARTQKLNTEYQELVDFAGGDKKAQKSLDDIKRILKKTEANGGKLTNEDLTTILGSDKNLEVLQKNPKELTKVAKFAQKENLIKNEASFITAIKAKNIDQIAAQAINIDKSQIGQKEAESGVVKEKLEVAINSTENKKNIILNFGNNKLTIESDKNANKKQVLEEINDSLDNNQPIKTALKKDASAIKEVLINIGFSKEEVKKYEMKDERIILKAPNTH